MRTTEIRFGPIYRGRDVHETPEGSSYNLTNVYRTKSGSIRKRPGYDLFKDYAAARYITKLWANPLDNTTNGIIVARNGAASDQIIDHLRIDGTVAVQINATSANIPNNADPSFVGITATRIGIAGGLDIVDLSGIPGAPSVATLTNGPSGTQSGHGLVMARGYLMATDSGTQLTYFNNNAALSFNTAADWRTYENNRKPDVALGIFNVRDEIMNLGYQSIEFAWLDGVTPWAEVDSSYIPYGSSHNVTGEQIEDDVYFPSLVDGYPKIVRVVGAGHSMEDIGRPIESMFVSNVAALAADGNMEMYLSRISAGHFKFDGTSYLTLSDWDVYNGITMLYDTRSKEWFRWGAYSGSVFTAFPFRSYAMPYITGSNTPTLGLKNYILASTTAQQSKIYAIDQSFANDDDTAIRCEVESGQITHGTPNEKRCHWYRFLVKRVDNGSFTLYTNDDNQGYDSGTTVSLDPVENAEYVMTEVRSMGTYRTRQIKLVHSSSTDDFELIKMWEGYEVLGQ